MPAALRLITDLAQLPTDWDVLLQQQDASSPFLSRAYLQRLQSSGSAVAETGWSACFVLLEEGGALRAGAPLWIKAHSWGEYVFDQAWARAYAQNGLRYYPKGVLAVPFAPVPGSRLLAVDAAARTELAQALMALAPELGLSGVHLLFGSAADAQAVAGLGWATREQPQFHWQRAAHWQSFEGFLADLRRDKRKKIQQERRQVLVDAEVELRIQVGAQIGNEDWAFWARCYERTYAVRGQAPYLADSFFAQEALPVGSEWWLCSAFHGGERIAASLCVWDRERATLYGRHWGALRELPCLHFECCYYQPIEWAIANGVQRFEGGAQGPHKMARGLLPVPTFSHHWLADERFLDAVQRFGEEEQAAVAAYEEELLARSPFKAAPVPAASASATPGHC